jgi:hypothetical protein
MDEGKEDWRGTFSRRTKNRVQMGDGNGERGKEERRRKGTGDGMGINQI